MDVLLILAILLYGYESMMDKHTKQLVISMIPKWIGLTILIIVMIYFLTK